MINKTSSDGGNKSCGTGAATGYKGIKSYMRSSKSFRSR